MKIKTSYLILKTDKPVKEDTSKLRGYFGNRFEEYPILHHHVKDVGYLYTYPRVQYRIIEGTPSLLGIEEGAKVMKNISSEVKELVLGRSKYRIIQRIIYEREVELKPTRRMIKYRFLTPWLALNPQNYKRYKKIRDWKEKKEFLNRILVGNILSMCKGLGIVVEKKLKAHSLIDDERIEYKGVTLLGFRGEFKVNFYIPDFFGIGKGVSQGFGVVRRN